MTNKDGISVEGLVERLRAKEHRGQFTMGGGSIDATGKGTTWGGEKIMEWRNPDGPAAADLILALSEREAAKDAEIAAIRVQGQEEGFAAAVAQLRDCGGWNPAHPMAHEAERLADALESSRLPKRAALTKGQVDAG